MEEGEIRLPKLPPGSPPPEEEWAPAIRMVVTSSEVLEVGTLFVVTQDGVTIGRYVCVSVCLCAHPSLSTPSQGNYGSNN